MTLFNKQITHCSSGVTRRGSRRVCSVVPAGAVHWSRERKVTVDIQ